MSRMGMSWMRRMSRMGMSWMRSLSSTNRLVVTYLTRNHELLHGHLMHGPEVHSHGVLAVVPLILAEVLTKVNSHFGYHDWILQVSLHPKQTLNALLAGVLPSLTDTCSLAYMESSVNKVVVHNSTQHVRIVHSYMFLTVRGIIQCRAVVTHKIGCHGFCSFLDKTS